MPRREDIEAELAAANFFSPLGANAGFHEIPLEQHSSKICTFATPFGRYRFLRLPFGTSSASEVFQKALNDVFEGMPGVRVYVDDVLIWGSDKAEQDERLRSALRAGRSAGLTSIAQKCKFGVQEIELLGDIISDKGISPNPALVANLVQLPRPDDKLAVQRLLGVVNYFGKYVPSLVQKTAALRSLIKQDPVFEWTHKHEEDWREICKALGEKPLLAVFDPRKETKVASDASQYGIRSALLQNFEGGCRPVAYASRALTDTEQRYSQIEKKGPSSTLWLRVLSFYIRSSAAT